MHSSDVKVRSLERLNWPKLPNKLALRPNLTSLSDCQKEYVQIKSCQNDMKYQTDSSHFLPRQKTSVQIHLHKVM